MGKFDDILDFIDLEKTIEEFGDLKNRNSKIVVPCPSCHGSRRTNVQSVRNSLKKFDKPYCKECSLKKIWEKPDFRRKQSSFRDEEYKRRASEKQKEVSKDIEYKRRASEKQKEVWGREGYKELQSEKQKEVWRREGYKKLQHEKQKEVWRREGYKEKFEKMWEDPDFKLLMSECGKIPWSDEKFRESVSSRSKNLWDDPSYRNAAVLSLKKRWEDPSYRKIKSEQSKRMWENEQYANLMAVVRSKQLTQVSSLEKSTENILKSLNIEYERQFPVGKWLWDFYLPHHDCYIDCQGEYWHSLPDRITRDAAKKTYLNKAFPESKSLYLYEKDFLNPEIIKRNVETSLGLSEINLIDFSFDDLSIRTIEKILYHDFLQSFHYSGRGRSAKVVYGAFLGEKLIAVCKFATPVRKEVATSMGYEYKEVLELDRFCIHPQYQKKNFASWFISRCVKLVTGEFEKIKCLVSFADTTYGHTGSIYKAANWKEVGRVKPDYYYVNEEGFILHKKTLYNQAIKMKMKEKEYAEKHGYVKVYGKEKIKFILTF